MSARSEILRAVAPVLAAGPALAATLPAASSVLAAAPGVDPVLALDVVLGLGLLAALALGWAGGLLCGLGAFLGLAAGGLGAMAAGPAIGDALGEDVAWRGPLVVAATLTLLLLGSGLGSGLGAAAGRGLRRTRLGWIDRLLGAFLGLAVGAGAVWLLGSLLTSAAIPRVSSAFASSNVVRGIESLTPQPVAQALARAGTTLHDDTLPAIGGALYGGDWRGTHLARPPQPLDIDDPVLASASESVVRITGPAYACGRSSSGSGFLVRESLVATNAHVVAGTDETVVEAPGGQVGDGEVVYFDPAADIAFIAVDIPVATLPLVEPVPAGTAAAVQGYPHGGPLTSVTAEVLARGQTLMSQAGAQDEAPRMREVFRLGTDVQPGNSGGPLLTEDGAVTGMIFAQDDTSPGVAYALTSTEITEALATIPQDAGQAAPVDVGACH